MRKQSTFFGSNYFDARAESAGASVIRAIVSENTSKLAQFPTLKVNVPQKYDGKQARFV